MKTNTYFESMTKTAEAYEAARQALKEKKQEIIGTHGWDSSEMEACKAEYEALKDPCQEILAAIQFVLERTPPELAGDIMRGGIHLTGGGSLLCGMDRFIATELDMPVLLAKEPMECAILGIGHLSENIDWLQRMIASPIQRDE